MQLEVSVSKKLAEFHLEVSFSCRSGRLLAITGPSGAGKTTVIRMIAGLELPDRGFVSCGRAVWEDTETGVRLPPGKRKIGYVFQEYSLFPHLSVRKNVAFAAENKNDVQKLLELFGISHLKSRKPQSISGGERQRTALAQALARKPDVLLLDEPFSALDIRTRQQLRNELKYLKKQLAIPIVLVTHDLNEALFLADEILPMDQGKAAPEWLNGIFTAGSTETVLPAGYMTPQRQNENFTKKSVTTGRAGGLRKPPGRGLNLSVCKKISFFPCSCLGTDPREAPASHPFS